MRARSFTRLWHTYRVQLWGATSVRADPSRWPLGFSPLSPQSGTRGPGAPFATVAVSLRASGFAGPRPACPLPRWHTASRPGPRDAWNLVRAPAAPGGPLQASARPLTRRNLGAPVRTRRGGGGVAWTRREARRAVPVRRSVWGTIQGGLLGRKGTIEIMRPGLFVF